jgi:hypothetical protein
MLLRMRLDISFHLLRVTGAMEASRHHASACFCTISFRLLLFIDFFGAHSSLNDYPIPKDFYSFSKIVRLLDAVHERPRC